MCPVINNVCYFLSYNIFSCYNEIPQFSTTRTLKVKQMLSITCCVYYTHTHRIGCIRRQMANNEILNFDRNGLIRTDFEIRHIVKNAMCQRENISPYPKSVRVSRCVFLWPYTSTGDTFCCVSCTTIYIHDANKSRPKANCLKHISQNYSAYKCGPSATILVHRASTQSTYTRI